MTNQEKVDLIKRLDFIKRECAESNWDSYNGYPVSEDEINKIRSFIDLIPPELVAPDISPDCYGILSLEWYGGKGRVFSLEFTPKNKIAWILQLQDIIFGEEGFNGEFPMIFIDLIKRVYL